MQPNDTPITIKVAAILRNRRQYFLCDGCTEFHRRWVPSLFLRTSIIVANASCIYTRAVYTYMHVFYFLLLMTAKKYLTRPEFADHTRDVAHPVLPPQGRQLPFAAMPQHRVIIKAKCLGCSHPLPKERLFMCRPRSINSSNTKKKEMRLFRASKGNE